jgi:nicotinate-nucleotide adenylyltransferase
VIPAALPTDLRLPAHAPGLRIGLFGGSFNPPHDGHVLASVVALRRLKLDRIWWLVTPGNPLKNNSGLPAQSLRIAQCRALLAARNISDLRVVVTGVETMLGTRFTADTLQKIQQRCPGTQFVWLMGSDNLAGFHRWRDWEGIAQRLPIAIIDRPGTTHRAARGHFAQRFANHRLDETDGKLLASRATPSWIFLHDRRSPLSSTALRATGKTG